MPELPNEAVKPLGAFAIAIMWLGVSVLLNKWPAMRHQSISKHAAANRGAFWWMAAVESVVIPLYLVFMWFWFIPTFALPVVFALLVAVSGLGFLAAAFTPARGKRQNRLHEIFAYTAASLLAPQLFIIGLSGSVSTFARSVALMVMAYMLYSVWLFFARPAARDRYLAYQSSYIFLYHLALLTTIYVR